MKEKRVHRKSETGEMIITSYLLLSVFLFINRIIISNLNSDTGNGYFALLYELLSIFYLFFLFTIPHILSKMVEIRTKKAQYQNANRVFQVGRKMLFFYGLTIGLCFFFGAKFISNNIFLLPKSYPALQVLAFIVVLMALIGVYRGHFQGLQSFMPTIFSKALSFILYFIFSILFMKLALNYGEKVGVLLKNSDFIGTYANLGVVISLLISLVFSLFFLVFVYRLFKPGYEKQMLRDRTTIHEPYPLIVHNLFLLHAPCFFLYAIYPIINLIGQILLHHHGNNQGNFAEIVTSYGAYSGSSQILIALPVWLMFPLSLLLEPKLKEKMDLNQMSLLRDRVSVVLKYTYLLMLMFTTLYFVMPDTILLVLFQNKTATAVHLLTTGSLLPIFLGLSLITSALLCSMEQSKHVFIHQIISSVLYLLIVILLFKTKATGVETLMIGKYVFAIALFTLNLLSLRKYGKLKQDYFGIFVVPFLLAVFSGVVLKIMKFILDSFHLPLLTFILLLLFGISIYFVVLCMMKVITEKDLRKLPFLESFIVLLKKGRLLP